MANKEKLTKINNELKVFINESSFISMKCRNKIIKYLGEEFNIKFDIDNYKNVDLKIKEDGTIIYRGDTYKSNDDIKSFNEVEERYNRFKEKAESLIYKKEIDFKNMSNMNNVTNLLIVIALIILYISFIILAIAAFLGGNFLDCFWLIPVIVVWIIPGIKNSINNRLTQAKNYLKSLIKKV